MNFKISKAADEWFGGKGAFEDKGLTNARLMDFYYFSALVGLLSFLKGSNKEFKNIEKIPDTREFMNEWTLDYKDNRYSIIGLLIETEIQRIIIDREDKNSVKEFFKSMLSTDSGIHLTTKGADRLSSYSYMGYLIISDEMKKMPETYETFLAKYYKILSKFIS